MIIICTGMDNTGKTTLVAELASLLPDVSVIGKSPGPLSKFEQEQWMLSQLNKNTKDTILLYDRFAFIEEMVYGNVLRDTPKFSFNDLVVESVKNQNPYIIYTRIPDQFIFNFGDREQYPGVIDKKVQLLKQCDNVYQELTYKGWNTVIYNYKNSSLETLVEDIIKTYEEGKR